jgi:iron complex outermembrane receptor protein
VAFGGFNKLLVPATSEGEDFGVRGSVGPRFFYDLAFFHLKTEHDFERYRVEERPLETFYANAGETSRNGFEASLRWLPTNHVTLSGAYTYSHFTYSHYVSQNYAGNLVGNFLPNSPSQQLYVNAIFDLPHAIKLSTDVMAFSRAFIDPTNAAFIDGYGLWGARFSKGWQKGRASGSFFVTGRNLTSTKYIAFTEPDPDGNSYQPGPTREVFGGMEIRF